MYRLGILTLKDSENWLRNENWLWFLSEFKSSHVLVVWLVLVIVIVECLQ